MASRNDRGISSPILSPMDNRVKDSFREDQFTQLPLRGGSGIIRDPEVGHHVTNIMTARARIALSRSGGPQSLGCRCRTSPGGTERGRPPDTDAYLDRASARTWANWSPRRMIATSKSSSLSQRWS